MSTRPDDEDFERKQISDDLSGSSGDDVSKVEYGNGSSWYEKPLEKLSSEEASANIVAGTLLGNSDYMGPEVRIRGNKLQSRSVSDDVDEIKQDTILEASKDSLESLYLAGAGKAILGDADVRKNIQYDSEVDRFYAFDYDQAGDKFSSVLPVVSSYIEDIASEITDIDDEEIRHEIIDRAAEIAAYTDFSRMENEMNQYNLDQSVKANVIENLERLQEYHISNQDPYELLDKSNKTSDSRGVEIL